MLEICTEYFISGVIEEEGRVLALFFEQRVLVISFYLCDSEVTGLRRGGCGVDNRKR